MARLPSATSAPAPASLRGLAPDLTHLPISINRHAISLSEGLRAACAVAPILIALEALRWPTLGTAALGALLTCLCDQGGPIRRRLPVLLSFTVLGTLLTLCGFQLRIAHPLAALPLGVAALFVFSLARIYGQGAQQAGTLLSVLGVLTVDRTLPFVPSPWVSAGSFLAGSAWAVLLTMVIWRVYPFAPARHALARTYDALADLTADMYALSRSQGIEPQAWEVQARTYRRAAREAIEAARTVVIDTLRSRGATSDRANQSVMRLESAEQILSLLVAWAALPHTEFHAAGTPALRILRRLRPILRQLAGAIERDDQYATARLERAVAAMEADAAVLAADLPQRILAQRIVERLRMAITQSSPRDFASGVSLDGQRVPFRQRVLQPLRANLTWHSPALRHACRVAVVGGAVLVIVALWPTYYGYWLTLTVVAVMQPFFALTYARMVERVIGTALGGIVAAVLALVCTTPWSIALAMGPLAAVALAVRGVSLGLFMTVLTPLVVLLVETAAPGADQWMIAVARASITAVGGALAVAASFLLWPNRQSDILVAATRTAITAHAAYAGAELGRLSGDSSAPAATAQAGRSAGLASNALEAAISQALTEPARHDADQLAAVLAVDAALRRLAGRVAVAHLDRTILEISAPELHAWQTWIQSAMQAATTSFAAESGKPAPAAALPARPRAATGSAMARIARQVDLISGAAARITAASAAGAAIPR